jgi:Asp-tRNA(Asn)/Glu-tRNA(Gln) amidotransferase A subunit family amidase
MAHKKAAVRIDSQGWMARFEPPVSGAQTGSLQGLTFAVKDMYEVAGHVNACGNPTWLATHGPARSTAPCVRRLLQAGATLLGMTHMDELAYSLSGENAHYGTPINQADPRRVPGGSSSGSAVRSCHTLCCATTTMPEPCRAASWVPQLVAATTSQTE